MKLCKCGAIVKDRCDRCYPSHAGGSSTKRGYDRQWRNVRERHLTDNPLCEDCMDRGITKAAEQVHHEITISDAPHLRLDRSNLRSLCVVCHAARHGSRVGGGQNVAGRSS